MNCQINVLLENDVFIKEIPPNEITSGKLLGQGSYGLVRKGVWRGKDVAVKLYFSDGEKKHFLSEIRTLAKLDHANIIKMYGTCTKDKVRLIMEYAECGSLDEILHGRRDIHYNLSHALNWVLQSARGVSYLHLFKPKPLMHRDIKPSNLLLFDSGRVIKLCDFGTVKTVECEMTNERGSASYMAPEVFQGSNYTEQGDIYSWGITLWEILSRRKPYKDLDGPALRILWAVSFYGTRPCLMQKCPKVLEDLMIACWKKEPTERPLMKQIEGVLQKIFDFYVAKNPDISISLDMKPKEHTNVLRIESSNANNLSECSETKESQNSSVSTESQEYPVIPLMDSEKINTNPSNLSLNKNCSNRVQSVLSDLKSDVFDSLDRGDLKMFHQRLLPYCPNGYCVKSVQIYEEHQSFSKKYLKKYFEAQLLKEKKRYYENNTLLARRPSEYFEHLEHERRKLIERKSRMLKELEDLKNLTYRNNDGWVLIDSLNKE